MPGMPVKSKKCPGGIVIPQRMIPSETITLTGAVHDPGHFSIKTGKTH